MYVSAPVASLISSATPPASLLWRSPGITALNTARPPTVSIAWRAEASSSATTESGTGTPTDFQSSFNSTSEAVADGTGKPVFGEAVKREAIRELSFNIRSAATARSGVGNTGSFIEANSLLASGARLADPVRATAIGRLRILRTAPSAFAIRSTSFPTSTAKQATIASTPESFAMTSRQRSNKSGEDMTAAVTSTGLAIFP